MRAFHLETLWSFSFMRADWNLMILIPTLGALASAHTTFTKAADGSLDLDDDTLDVMDYIRDIKAKRNA